MPSFLDEWSGINDVIYLGCMFVGGSGLSYNSGENTAATARKVTVSCLYVADP
jgi:hypothetical protein